MIKSPLNKKKWLNNFSAMRTIDDTSSFLYLIFDPVHCDFQFRLSTFVDFTY
jgi:hypothetical protein